MRKLLTSEMNRKTVEKFRESEKIPIVIILDNVRSLNNIGSIFRTADAFLVKAIYLCGISATPPNKEIHKTALGAEDTVAWKYHGTSLSALEFLKTEGYELIAIEQTDESISLDIFPVDRDKKYALIFGNEVRGVDQEVVDYCSASVEIPQFGTKHSFNVSVTVGIVLWEWSKKMRKFM
jgi:tRNA G18 (ribose-2'-O)-methylase SpoU